MKCRYCGAEIPDGSAFCPNCGKKIEKVRRCVKSHSVLLRNTTATATTWTDGAKRQNKQPISQRPTQQTLNQSSQPMSETPTYEEQTDSSNKWLWIVVAAVVAVIAIGGVRALSFKLI